MIRTKQVEEQPKGEGEGEDRESNTEMTTKQSSPGKGQKGTTQGQRSTEFNGGRRSIRV